MLQKLASRVGKGMSAVSAVSVAALLSACSSLPQQSNVAYSPSSVPSQNGVSQPNVIVIVADDLGYNDISLNGNPLVRTPNIDRLATDGARFSHAYSANAVCAPSRAALLTGVQQQQFGFEFNPFAPAYLDNLPKTEAEAKARDTMVIPLAPDAIPDLGEIGIPASQPTLAERLKQRGYATSAIGKWHLGGAPQMQPTAKGFDEFFGFLGGAGLFAPVDAPWVVNARLDSDFDRATWAHVTHAVLDQGQVVHPDKHLTDVFADEAVDFIERKSDEPFFLYLAFNAPHNPLQARKDYYDRLSFIKDHKTRVYYAMVEQMDDAIGRVIAAVERAGKAEETLIIFTSDNGGAHYTAIPYHNLPYRGWKATFYEGGVVVPLHMYWPGKIAPGGRVVDPVSLLDIAPTALQASGTPAPANFDGRTLIDANGALLLPGEDRPFFWRTEHYKVVRQGKYKLQVTKYPEATRLYNLSEDPAERVDIASRHGEIVADLKRKLEAWEATLREPRWPAIQRLKINIDGYQNWDIDDDYIFFAL